MTDFERGYKEFSQLPNVTILNSLKELEKKVIKVETLKDFISKNRDTNVDDFVFKDNCLVLFDCEDENSAFLHEYYLNAIKEFPEYKDIQIFFIKSDKEIKKFIENHHIWSGIKTDEHEGKKYEIFMMLIFENEYYYKSDDFDIINQNAIINGLEILNS